MKETSITPNSLKAWVLAARPKTLTGAAVPVLIGTMLALADHQWQIGWLPCVLCFLFAFLMQIDANFVNDYLIGNVAMMMRRRGWGRSVRAQWGG